MKPSLDCMPCLLNQALKTARRFVPDPGRQEAILRTVLQELATFDFSRTAPEMGAFIHRTVAAAVGEEDLYRVEKSRFNTHMLEYLPALRKLVETAPDPFLAAVKTAVIGNLIDVTAPGGKTEEPLDTLFETCFEHPLLDFGTDAISRLKSRAESAKKITYVTDNAGEIVADRLLIEQLPSATVTIVVRGGPIANDATIADAIDAGLDRLAPVIDSGLVLPGIRRQRCAPEAENAFEGADLVISKGQGNFETLEMEPDKIFYLFVIKCAHVARLIGGRIGDLVVIDRLGASRANMIDAGDT